MDRSHTSLPFFRDSKSGLVTNQRGSSEKRNKSSVKCERRNKLTCETSLIRRGASKADVEAVIFDGIAMAHLSLCSKSYQNQVYGNELHFIPNLFTETLYLINALN